MPVQLSNVYRAAAVFEAFEEFFCLKEQSPWLGEGTVEAKKPWVGTGRKSESALE
jgi:hypothetical protein